MQTAMDVWDKVSKICDIVESSEEFYKTLRNNSLDPTIRLVKCTAEGVFAAARAGELIVKDVVIKPILNGISTASNVGRKIIDGHIAGQVRSEIVKNVALVTISGVGETFINISFIPNLSYGWIFQWTGYTLSTISFYLNNRETIERWLRGNNRFNHQLLARGL